MFYPDVGGENLVLQILKRNKKKISVNNDVIDREIGIMTHGPIHTQAVYNYVSIWLTGRSKKKVVGILC